MANIPDNDHEVPLLLVSWHVSVNPSNVIMLESSIAIATNNNDEISSGDVNFSHCFDIVSTNNNNGCNNGQHYQSTNSNRLKLSNGKLARTFSTELINRNEWVSKINQTIRDYDRLKKMTMRHDLPPVSPTKRSTQFLDLNGLNIAC